MTLFNIKIDVRTNLYCQLLQ